MSTENPTPPPTPALSTQTSLLINPPNLPLNSAPDPTPTPTPSPAPFPVPVPRNDGGTLDSGDPANRTAVGDWAASATVGGTGNAAEGYW